MVTRSHARPTEPQGGFSLVESMLAVALFSLGLLGAGALVTERLRDSRAAHSYFLAEMLAEDLAARIEVDPAALGGEDFQAWKRQAMTTLRGLRCEATDLGGAPPAYRVELSWPLGSGESGRLVIWLGR